MEFASADRPPAASKNQTQFEENGLPSSFPTTDADVMEEENVEALTPVDTSSNDSTSPEEPPSSSGDSEKESENDSESGSADNSANEPLAKAPLGNAFTANEPSGNEPSDNEPLTNESLANEPSGNELPGNELSDNDSSGNDSSGNSPPANEPSGNDPIVEADSVTSPSDNDGPAADAPSPDLSASEATVPLGESGAPEVDGLDAQLLKPASSLIDLSAAQFQASPTFQLQGGLRNSDAANADDLFKFTLARSGVFTANLTELTGDADVQLIQDKNANGIADPGEILAWQWERGAASESIRSFLGAGDYIVRVASYNQSNADYQLETTFAQANQDDRAFSIELTTRSGLDVLSDEAMASIQRAADFWNDVISHSSLDGPQTLFINLFGTLDDENFLAYAGPQSYQTTADGRQLPRRGSVVINTSYADLYNGNPDYLESVIRHELGHVFGFGVAWDSRGNDFVNPDNQTYRANTQAAYAYGELLGEFRAVEIPLDDQSAHWKESILDSELMTPRAETQGTSMPLSQVTIASLQDLGWNVNYGAAEAFTLPTPVA